MAWPSRNRTLHHRAGQRPVRPRPHAHEQVRLLRRRVAVRVDDDDLRSAPAAGGERVGHDVDLRRRGVGAPDDDEVRPRHLPRVRARELARAGDESAPGERHADRRVLARVTLGVAQAVDAVAHQEPHRARVVVRPDGFGPVAPLRVEQCLRGDVERIVPGDGLEARAPALLADPAQWRRQAVRMVDALGVAGDLAADDAGRVRVVAGAADAADGLLVQAFHRERAGGRAVVGTDAVADLGLCGHAFRGSSRARRVTGGVGGLPAGVTASSRAPRAYDFAQFIARGSLIPCAKPPCGVARKSSRPRITRIS